MARVPLSALETAFVRLAQDVAGVPAARQRAVDLLAPLFHARGVAPGTAGVSIEDEGGALVLVTPDPAADASDFDPCERCPHPVICETCARCSFLSRCAE